MTLTQWDNEIAPYLADLEHTGRRLSSSAHDLKLPLRMLKSRPQWLARSSEALKAAEAALADTLAQVREARAQYDALPVEE